MILGLAGQRVRNSLSVWFRIETVHCDRRPSANREEKKMKNRRVFRAFPVTDCFPLIASASADDIEVEPVCAALMIRELNSM